MKKINSNLIDPHLVAEIIQELNGSSRFLETREYIQHGNTSVYQHSIQVAYLCVDIVNFFHISVDEKALIRGALLHDYFLYDWHDFSKEHRLHGFTHPRKALENAQEDLVLNKIEENIILRHMFPLTPVPPKYREAWILCLADKISSVRETIGDRKKACFNFINNFLVGRSWIE